VYTVSYPAITWSRILSNRGFIISVQVCVPAVYHEVENIEIFNEWSYFKVISIKIPVVDYSLTTQNYAVTVGQCLKKR